MASVTFIQTNTRILVNACGTTIGSIKKDDKQLYRFQLVDGKQGCPYDSLEDLKDDIRHELQ